MQSSKRSSSSRNILFRVMAIALVLCHSVVFAAPPPPNALPTGGQVAQGQAAINTNGSSMNINQSTQKAVINWQTFNIGQNTGVNFSQPNGSSIALNRVLSGDPSAIYGKMTANGQIFLLNPAGIIFGPSGSVNVGGLVASTLSLNDNDFMNGNYNFYNAGGAGSIVNQGSITAADGGYVALLAPQITNQGIISARMGTVAMAAGDQVSLDFNGDGLINFTVNQGTVNALIDNRNLVQADGGQVIMTARAADSLSSAVVNNEGVIQAQTIGNSNGVIRLMGDMQNGTVNVSGTLDASAPNGGNGGFIETSAATVNVADGARITTLAPKGQAGLWLLDPSDISIQTGGSGALTSGAFNPAGASGTISPSTILTGLANGNVTIQTSGGTGGNGDITLVNSITTTSSLGASRVLTLEAYRNIIFNNGANIDATGGNTYKLNLVLWSDSGGNNNGGIGLYGNTIKTNGGSIWMGGGSASSTSQTGFSGITVPTGYAWGNGGSAQTNGSGIWVYGLSGATIIDAGGGNIMMKGHGNSAGSQMPSENNTRSKGIDFNLVGPPTHTGQITTTGSGFITLDGIGGATTGNFSYGVNLHRTQVTTQNGDIIITGTGGGNGSDTNHGIFLEDNNNLIKATGSGNITLTGTKGAGSGSYGILSGSSSWLLDNIQTTTGALQLTSRGNLTIYGTLNSGTTTNMVAQSADTSTNYNITATNTGNAFGDVVTLTGQNIDVVAGSAMTLGAVTSTGTVDVETVTGNLTVSQNITTTDTTASALTLVAGNTTAAGTSTGGNILVSGTPTISTGTGGFATLYTGSVDNSSGLTSLSGLSSGSGRFRYNSDNQGSTGYDTTLNALSAGINAIYREQPTVTITANNATAYSGTAYSGGNGVAYSGLKNGDTSAMLSGTLTYSGNSQGASSAGTYTITPGGITNGLGYNLAFANGTLTISAPPKTTTTTTPTTTTTTTITTTTTPTSTTTTSTTTTPQTTTITPLTTTTINAGSMQVITTNTTTAQTTQQQVTPTPNPAAPAGAAGGSGQTSFSGGLITVNTTPAVTAPVATGEGTPSTGSLRLAVGGENIGNMNVTNQGGATTVSVVPSSSQPVSAASKTGGTAQGALTIYTAAGGGTQVEGNFAVNTGSGSVTLTQAAAPVTPAPITVSDGGKSANFSITTADGVVLDYRVSQSGNTLNIHPANDAAGSATGSIDKKLLTATCILACEDKLGTVGSQVTAVVINNNR
ncbi:MAG: filamentous hemagglutinin N-terminal domain-containing protein [Nitrospirae bacterium]|nr:filamentous hemagglutinin N-terminal domain-containing protein [Nitrospirota bacterium]